MDALRARIAGSIPWKFGLVRFAKLEPIERTEVVIPDDVLVTYADAVDLGLFARFMVARATYYWVPQPNPWLVLNPAFPLCSVDFSLWMQRILKI